MTVVTHESRCGWQEQQSRVEVPGLRGFRTMDGGERICSKDSVPRRAVALPTRRTAASCRHIAAQLHPSPAIAEGEH